MALMACKECNHQISDQASKCPNCGAKVKRKTSILTWVAGGIMLSAIIAGLSQTNKPTAPAPVAKTPEEVASAAKHTARLQAAGAGAMALKRGAKDPASFKLTQLLSMPSGAACYEYRAVNSFGANLPGSAVLTQKGKILIKERDGNTFVAAWNKECTTTGEDITKIVERLGILD